MTKLSENLASDNAGTSSSVEWDKQVKRLRVLRWP